MIKKGLIRRVITDDKGQFVSQSWVARSMFKDGDYIALIYNDDIIRYDDLLELHKELSASREVLYGLDESVKNERMIEKLDLMLDDVWFIFAQASDGEVMTKTTADGQTVVADERTTKLNIKALKWIADKIGIKIDKSAYKFDFNFDIN